MATLIMTWHGPLAGGVRKTAERLLRPAGPKREPLRADHDDVRQANRLGVRTHAARTSEIAVSFCEFLKADGAHRNCPGVLPKNPP